MDGRNHGGTGIPVVAVLPLLASGADRESALIAEGLHEEICGALTRFRSLRVISPHSAAAVAALQDAEIGARLGATHLLRGRLLSDGVRLRLRASLVGCLDARQLWDDRLEVPLDDLMAAQDELVARIAATLNARLEEAALAEARRRPADLAAHALVLRGIATLREGTLEGDEAARALFEQALAIDPMHARAHAGIAMSWFNDWSCQFWDRFDEASRQAYVHAHRALDLDDSDGVVHMVVAKVQLFRRAWEQASWYLDRALTLCPNDADLLMQAAMLEVYLGRPEAGIDHITRAMRLNPYHPNAYYGIAAFAHAFAGDLPTAVAFGERSDVMPFVDSPGYAAVALAHSGRMEAAREELARFHDAFRAKIAYGGEVAPGEPLRWLLAINPHRRSQDIDFILAGFRLLGEATAPEHPREEPPGAARLVRTESGWLAEFAGRQAGMPDLKGLHDIRRLLERPGEEIHCLDLAERAEAALGSDTALDDRARAALKARIRDLQEELAEAEDMNDLGRAERARDEMDRLIEALSQALGLGGRGRRLGDLAERARTTVTWRIRYALRRIEAMHPPLGRHLAQALRTGTFCLYKPAEPVAWRFAPPPAV